jgi:molybdate transport system substrate-binding protein
MFCALILAALPIEASAGGAGGAQPGEPPLVAAAADLQFALSKVAEAFKRDTGQEVKLAFGSSGNLTRQIRQNAPFQLFFSADENFVTHLAKAGFARDEGVLYAIGRIVLIVPKGSPLKAAGSLADLKAAVADGRLKKFAIANPEHAPYGRRAEEAMRHVGLWDAIKDKLVLGENVSQAAQFATSGNVQGGIIAYSLALSEQVKGLGAFELIPAEWHQPLRQRMVLLRNAGPTAVRFYDYVQQPAARTLLREYGFVLPGEAS